MTHHRERECNSCAPLKSICEIKHGGLDTNTPYAIYSGRDGDVSLTPISQKGCPVLKNNNDGTATFSTAGGSVDVLTSPLEFRDVNVISDDEFSALPDNAKAPGDSFRVMDDDNCTFKDFEVGEDGMDYMQDGCPIREDESFYIPANFAPPHRYATVAQALMEISTRNIKSGVRPEIIIQNGYVANDNDKEWVGLHNSGCVDIRAETPVIKIEDSEWQRTPMTGGSTADLAANLADQAFNEALVRSRYGVVIEVASGWAMQLKGGDLGDVSDIAFIGTPGNTAGGINSGTRRGPGGQGAQIRLDRVVISGFRTSNAIVTTYGGHIYGTDDTITAMYCKVNIRTQFGGVVFTKGASVFGANLYNVFGKRYGVIYLSGDTGNNTYRGYVGHSLISNVALSGSAILNSLSVDYGPCGGISMFLAGGGNVVLEGSTFYGSGSDTIRNGGGIIQAQSVKFMSSGGYHLRQTIGTADLQAAEMRDATFPAIYGSGGEILLGPNAAFKTQIASNNGGIINLGAKITGSAGFDASATQGGAIGTFIRHQAGTTDISNATFAVGSTASTRTVYVTRWAYGSLRLIDATVAGSLIAASDILVFNRDLTSMSPFTGNGKLEYSRDNIDLVAA